MRTSDGLGSRARSGPQANQQPAGRVVVEVQNFRNDKGDALGALFRSALGFPQDPLQAERRVATTIEQGRSTIVFDDVAPGAFAISVLHDERRDRKVRTGLLGIPRDGIGFSRDARGKMGPPKFKDAEVMLTAGATVTVVVHMHYY